MTERALFINNLQQIAGLKDFTRLYFGAEYCPHLMPNLSEVIKAYELSQKNNWHFTLVTPICYEINRPALEELLEDFAKYVQSAEVVVNDWGIFHYLTSNFQQLSPVIGRLLTRQKRFNQQISLTEPEKQHFATIPLLHPHIKKWLENHCVQRVELDKEDGLAALPTETNLRFSLYLPYSLLSVTRYCGASAGVVRGWQNYRHCQQACRRNIIYLMNKELTQPLIIKGCAKMYAPSPLPSEVGGNIDRLVWLAEII